MKLSNHFKAYLVVGISVYILELAIILVAQLLGASSILAVALSFWIGLMISFVLQKFVTFGDKRIKRRVILTQLIAYALLVLFNFCFTLLVTKLLSPTLPATVSRTIALAITTLWNFYLYKTKLFNVSDKTVIY